MHSKTLIGLIVLSLFCPMLAIPSNGEVDREQEFQEAKVKALVQKLGAGESPKVKVSLKNRNVLNGYIQQSFDRYFILIVSGRDDLRIQYSEVLKIEKYREAKTVKTALTAAAAVAGAVALLSFLLYWSSD